MGWPIRNRDASHESVALWAKCGTRYVDLSHSLAVVTRTHTDKLLPVTRN